MSGFEVRWATPADAGIIGRHRVGMFSDMGELPPHLSSDLYDRTLAYLAAAIPRGEYVGWLASPAGQPDVVAGGAGVLVRRTLPHPIVAGPGDARIAHGTQAVALNVFTEQPWRRQGVAALLMQHVIEWAAASDIDTLVLHASDDGRALYERLGFVPSNLMRYARPLR